ncbi:MAG: hypothetical protein WHT46_05760 [Candidatus Geothermincolales bacterium]
MDDEELVGLLSLVKRQVFDSEANDIGHVQDLAVDLEGSPPRITDLAVHLSWTDRVGDILLPRAVEDIVLLIPWSEVQSWDHEGFRLGSPHPDLPVNSAEGKVLLRRDLLNKQILDEEGNRLHRVDDVLLRREGMLLLLEGLQVGAEWLPLGGKFNDLLSRLKKKYGREHDEGEAKLVPYQAILRVDEEAITIRSRL